MNMEVKNISLQVRKVINIPQEFSSQGFVRVCRYDQYLCSYVYLCEYV